MTTSDKKTKKGGKALNRPAGKARNSQQMDNRPAQAKTTTSKWKFSPTTARRIAYGVGFAALVFFLGAVYGDVLYRAEQESYVSTSPDTMHYVLSESWGSWRVLGRWALLPARWPWLMALLLAALFTLQAWLTDRMLGLKASLSGVGFIVPAAFMLWMLWRGTNLYYKNEPGFITLIPLLITAVLLLLAATAWVVRRVNAAPKIEEKPTLPFGALLAPALVTALTMGAWKTNENVILTARLQNLMWEHDWETMVEEARAAQRPSRAVAAYHAIGLLQQGKLLDEVFDIAYDYPKLKLDSIDGNEEYGIFNADCNFHAGLLNPAYREAMDRVVMNGPRIVYFKRMAECALLNGETKLCEKYVKLLEDVPFESGFTKRMRELMRQREKIQEDETYQRIISMLPRDTAFEQNFRSPAFLGYNLGLNSGSDATLLTSAAACLYSKDLKSALPRLQIMASKGMSLPSCLQQVIAILKLTHPELAAELPPVNSFVENELKAFLSDAKPYVKDRLALRRELKERWLGTYFYYYYCENNDPDQVIKRDNTEKAGVN